MMGYFSYLIGILDQNIFPSNMEILEPDKIFRRLRDISQSLEQFSTEANDFLVLKESHWINLSFVLNICGIKYMERELRDMNEWRTEGYPNIF